MTAAAYRQELGQTLDQTEKYGFKPKHNLLPIPGAETRLNGVIKQNPGW